ncbi:hypothetical protein [Herbiconiux sp. L3-i23]|uniref:glycoside hydrolase family 38 N-terminal domain-containing protein n=1 Tax=Herbiconiux sp. L3-i23 TaxID=2905871 RepID=UPI00204C97A9|nr:hypothetical protein [Herbiconiux sp. L3-i23]BDI21472.1 hypothetical protein L3i23_02480 [Herbiconiux sp. L3-i23]
MSAIRRIVLVGHTHHDVGYTNSPRIIDRMHRQIVHEVLDLADAHGTEGPDGFRWTFEVSRPSLGFLRTASERDVARLRHRVDEGAIAVTGGYLNPTQLASQQELDATYDLLGAFAEAGIPVRTQQHGDVNGLSWGSVAAMRRAGIERLVMALNPDHGRPPFEQPTGFWWEAPSRERIFVWLSTHYGFGEEWGIIDADLDLATANIERFIERLGERDDYPYDTALVHAANDNRWPTALFLELVRHWNASHPDIPMETATIDSALDLLIPQAEAADIPVVSGEWADWWSHGHGSTAREVAVYREARSLALSAQSSLALARLRGERDGDTTLSTVLGYRRAPVRLRSDDEIAHDLAEVDEQLMLWNEHTWGSWETYSKPYSTFSFSHWNGKAAFAYTAYDFARDLAVEGLFRLTASGNGGDAVSDSIAIVNPTEVDRTEPITVEIDGTRRLTFLAEDVPAFSVKVVPIDRSLPETREADSAANGRYEVTVDPSRGGVVSLVHRASGRELIDRDAGHGLGAVVVEQVEAGSTHPMVTTNPKDFHPDHPGPIFDRSVSSGDGSPQVLQHAGMTEIRWTGAAPTAPSVTSTLRVFDDSDLVELEVELVKPEVFDPESIFVAFPFAIRSPQFLLETAGAVFEADAEQLPDTSKDWYSIQHAIGVDGPDGAVLWGSVDAPLVQLGDFQTGRWARELAAPDGHINSWLMNNLHFTNFQARQDGTWRYRYRFLPVATVSKEAVHRFGRDLLQPLHSRGYDGIVGTTAEAGLTVSPADRVLTELRPLADGGVRIRLRNPSGEPVAVSLAWEDGSVAFDQDEVELAPYGFAETIARRTV